MKSFWISCVALELALFAMVSPVSAAKRKWLDPEDLTNLLLSPEYSHWLVGPVARIASDAEVRAYLALQSDEAAEAFIESFWDERGGDVVFPTKGKKVIFEERAAEADRRFSEGTFRGRRTDRGTIFILYGEPDEYVYESPRRRNGQPIEVWVYPKDSEKGLDDRKPERRYRFVKHGELTEFYRGPTPRPLARPVG